ncbi:MAG: hypothetical protein M1821_009752 [Bathelium mastoideum]|nr:MAG: hypothetical protein M1821_009752 [Bathelium mastoideum]
MIPLGVVVYSGAGTAVEERSVSFPLKRPKFPGVRKLQNPGARDDESTTRSPSLSSAAESAESDEACASLDASDRSPSPRLVRPSRPKHVPIIVPDYVPLVARNQPLSPERSPTKTDFSTASSGTLSSDCSLRVRNAFADSERSVPRHVEIVIPDWARPVLQLPDTPTSLPSPRKEEQRRSVTPKARLDSPQSPPTMSRQNQETSRSNTIDSNTSAPSPSQLNSSRFRSGSQQNLSGLRNGSETSLNRQNAYDSATESARPNGTRNAGASQPQGPPSSAAQRTAGLGTSTTATTNVSGLVCNVHRTTGREPHPSVGATTTILGDKLYVFGGRRLSKSRPQLISDLFELDLTTRHWTKLETKGEVPTPRYFHSVCALGDTKLVCYGGMCPVTLPAGQNGTQTNPQEPQPEFLVMSDIHIFDVPTKTWMKIPIPANESPQGRYAHCATILPSSGIFGSPNAPMSAISHNPSTSPNSGSLGVSLDGTGGAEMVVVGGQDSANHYIEQISVFNLRSLKWTGTIPLGRSCGAYRSVVAPLQSLKSSQIGAGPNPDGQEQEDTKLTDSGSSMLIYSNYNFLDVKLELQIRKPDGSLVEKPMQSHFSPPGLRFPNGGVINNHFVVSGTFLRSSSQEYALWALDLKSLQWYRIDAGGNIFNQGSWNRGILWPRRNMFVVLGNRKRSLVEDYTQRRINFSNICMVELEAFGLFDNPRRISPTSDFVSVSAPPIPYKINRNSNIKSTTAAAGRKIWAGAEDLGIMALEYKELADMDFLAIGGERIPVNSHFVARRWGPYFNQLLREGAATASGSVETETATLRPGALASYPSRNSSLTITPQGAGTQGTPTPPTSSGTAGGGPRASVATGSSGGTTVAPSSLSSTSKDREKEVPNLYQPPDPRSSPPAKRPRTLYLPHTAPTLRTLLHYLYTSALPPPNSADCSPQILCSLLQLARPYHVDGLLEAVVERLHQVLDGRNTAAIFNASAMAAGGGGAVAFAGVGAGLLSLDGALALGERSAGQQQPASAGPLRINTNLPNGSALGQRGPRPTRRPRQDSNAAAGSASTSEADGEDTDQDRMSSVSDTSASELSSTEGRGRGVVGGGAGGSSSHGDGSSSGAGQKGEVWIGGVSSVVGLQKRGLRGLMEGRRMRERGRGEGPGAGGGGGAGANGVGLGIA